MDQTQPTPDVSFFAAFAGPAWVVMMVAQMLLGLAFVFALTLKYYMVVFGTAVCTADDDTLGNMIRCTPTLVMTAHFLIAVAAFRLARCMFVDRPLAVLPPLMLLLAGVFVLFLTGVSASSASWALAAVILALLVSLGASLFAYYWFDLRKKAE